MLVYIDEARCTGCGACLPACPEGAISLDDGIAVIDSELCRQCGACIPMCPESAILEAFEDQTALNETVPQTRTERLPLATRPGVLSPTVKKWLPAIGAGLVAVGKAVIPRLAEAIVDAVERRLATSDEPTDNTSSSISPASAVKPSGRSASPDSAARSGRHRRRGRS